MMGSASSGTSFLTIKYKRFSKFIKEIYSHMYFQFVPIKIIVYGHYGDYGNIAIMAIVGI